MKDLETTLGLKPEQIQDLMKRTGKNLDDFTKVVKNGELDSLLEIPEMNMKYLMKQTGKNADEIADWLKRNDIDLKDIKPKNVDDIIKGVSGAGNIKVPQKATDIANQVKAKNGTPPQGYKGGKVYQNMPSGSGEKLPEGINYKEYDMNPYIKGQDRGLERIVIGDDGSVWYTNNHYETFTKLE